MTELPLLSFIAAAFGLGLLHALDADHLMTVSSLMSRNQSLKRSILYCAHWSLGHGGAILLAGGAAILLGTSVPEHMSRVAEGVAGLLLIWLGSWTLYDVFYHYRRLPESRHREHFNLTSALLIGCVHGMAGTASVVAFIPLSQSASPWQGLAYLLVFIIAVLLGMLSFGTLFSRTWRHFNHLKYFTQALRFIIAAACVVTGGILMGVAA